MRKHRDRLWETLGALGAVAFGAGLLLYPVHVQESVAASSLYCLTDQPERVIAGEIVREKVLRLLDKEVPHGVAAVTERMKDRDGILDIDVTIYCEKSGHKGILIGKGGAMLKKIGTNARQDMERFFDCKVNLQLWVKVKEDWRQCPETLQSLGFSEKDLEM